MRTVDAVDMLGWLRGSEGIELTWKAGDFSTVELDCVGTFIEIRGQWRLRRHCPC